MKGPLAVEDPVTDARTASLLTHFRSAFGADAGATYRDWFRAQEELRKTGDATTARLLADDLWVLVPGLAFPSDEARARFLHNAGVFFGSPGPAADLDRARQCFEAALTHFAEHGEDGWRARALHNFATALSNLGATPSELDEAIRLFDEALAWRTAQREIARAVTLHNMGLAWRRLAGLEPVRSSEALDKSAACLKEAVAIRARHGLSESLAASENELARTLATLAGP